MPLLCVWSSVKHLNTIMEEMHHLVLPFLYMDALSIEHQNTGLDAVLDKLCLSVCPSIFICLSSSGIVIPLAPVPFITFTLQPCPTQPGTATVLMWGPSVPAPLPCAQRRPTDGDTEVGAGLCATKIQGYVTSEDALLVRQHRSCAHIFRICEYSHLICPDRVLLWGYPVYHKAFRRTVQIQ